MFGSHILKAAAPFLAFGSLVTFSTAAFAEGTRNCGPRDDVVAHLAKGYGETAQSIGLDARGGLLEVYASTDSGSWTVTLTSPQGVTCMIASGQSFETLAGTLAAKGEGA